MTDGAGEVTIHLLLTCSLLKAVLEGLLEDVNRLHSAEMKEATHMGDALILTVKAKKSECL